MTRSKTFLMVSGIIFLILWSYSEWKTEENDGWIHYGKSECGDFYYDRIGISFVSPKVLQVWDKMEYSGKGKETYIQWRKKDKSSIDGYENLSITMSLFEIDCKNSTITTMSTTDYKSNEYILDLVSTNYPVKSLIVSGSRGELLSRTVCPK